MVCACIISFFYINLEGVFLLFHYYCIDIIHQGFSSNKIVFSTTHSVEARVCRVLIKNECQVI
jgi:hypothetical protein